MRIAYFDCFSGAAGDMIVGSLIDSGADAARLGEALKGLPLTDYSVSAQRVDKQGLAATKFCVHLTGTPQPHRHLRHILEILEAAKVSPNVREQAGRVFRRLAEAEAKVHGTAIEKVHFHEVGAVDAIVDVVGALLALEMLGVDRVACSPIPVGSGTVVSEHGVLPVPAPATAELLKGVPLAPCDEPGELTTPTGAAILTTLAAEFGPIPAMIPAAVGYGAGTRDGQKRPNVLRVTIGRASEPADAQMDVVTLLETNLDDATPQQVAYCVERLFDRGALDVWTVPIHMKKQRTGVVVSVLCTPKDADELERVLFVETPTFGIRRRMVERSILRRRTETVVTPYGEIRMKVGSADGLAKAAPEFDDCRGAALRCGVPLRDVVAAAQTAWQMSRPSR